MTCYFSQSFHLIFSNPTSTIYTGTLSKAIAMESQGRKITSCTEGAGQAQIRNDGNMQQGSKNTSQETNFLQQTGEGVNSMAQGAATMAGGAVHGAASIVQGAATGVSNLTGGAASAVKNTLGSNNENTTTTTNNPGKPKY